MPHREETPDHVPTSRKVLFRDVIIFSIKLALDGLKDVVLLQLSLLAAAADFVLMRPGRNLLFYKVMRASERFDLWLNLHSASEVAESSGTGLFGGSRAGADTLLGKLESVVRDHASRVDFEKYGLDADEWRRVASDEWEEETPKETRRGDGEPGDGEPGDGKPGEGERRNGEPGEGDRGRGSGTRG